jgi:formate dehydrogenase iron-sulfur subunit
MARPRIFVPRDAAALAVGSDDVDRAIVAALRRRQIDGEIVRTGSRGLFWLEPMIEVASGGERVACGPVAAGDVEGLFDAGFLDGKSHALRLGQPETILFLKRPAAAHFRALRHRRSAVAGGLLCHAHRLAANTHRHNSHGAAFNYALAE